jgi:hypothetical protein
VFPRARHDDLTVRELPDETLVYDRRRHKAHCLNVTAALVWSRCDGRTSVADLAQIVTRELGVADAVGVVTLALEQLGNRHLLDEAPERLRSEARLSRRDALRKLAAAAVVLPLVLTVTPRLAAQTMSGSSSAHVAIEPTIEVLAQTAAQRQKTPPTPCRTRGQSCVAAASGQQGTCCPGLRCNGVAQNAGVCG